MTTARSLFLLVLMLGLVALCDPAQMPSDNDAWKARCEVLKAADPALNGTVPPWLLNAPGAVAGPRWTTFGWDRDRAMQPAVACVFFYLGAIADRKEDAGHADRIHSEESATMGLIEWQQLHHIEPTVAQKLTRDHAKLAEIPKPALTVAEEQSMVDTGGVMPLTPTH